MTKQKEQGTIFEDTMTGKVQVQQESYHATTPAMLLEKAIEKGLGVPELEKLMELQQKWLERQARIDFFQALSEFQRIRPSLQKSKKVNFSTQKGTTNYNYIPLSEIESQIKGPLSQCGLTYRFEIEDKKVSPVSVEDVLLFAIKQNIDPNKLEEFEAKAREFIRLIEKPIISVTCFVNHINGHVEKTTMTANPDDSGGKNAIQQRGSTITYLQRYSLIAALGISSADADTDANSKNKGKQEPDKDQFADIIARAKAGKLDLKKMSTVFVLNDEQEHKLRDVMDNLKK